MSEITRGAIGMPFEMAMESELSSRQFHSIAQALLIERDQLRAEVAGLRTGYEAYEQVNAGLKAEVDGLRKAAGEVLSWVEAKHRPPVADQIEHGRMALVRLHALAELDAALGQGEQS